MRLLDRLLGVEDVARVTIRFREDGNHQLVVEQGPSLPAGLQGPALDAALFLHYAVKSLHALGAGRAADELRQRIRLSGIELRGNKYESFRSCIDAPGECIGRLQANRSGSLWLNATFRVPLADTNNYVIDSALLLLSRAAESQTTHALRNRLADAIEEMEAYYRTTADTSSLQALRHAAAMAFAAYQASDRPDGASSSIGQGAEVSRPAGPDLAPGLIQQRLIRPRWRFAERPVCESVYRDGDKYVIVGGKGQSGLHAIAHARLRMLETTGRPISRAAVEAIESWVGINDGVWPPVDEERFVIAAEAYMAKQASVIRQTTAVDVPVELEPAFAELFPVPRSAGSKPSGTAASQVTGRGHGDQTLPE